MKRIFGISGSLRAESFNASLLRAAVEAAPDDVVVEVHTIRGVPIYDGDLEAREGLPEAVVRLQEALRSAGGMLLVTPEYNNGIPGAFKNTIDWMSRPPAGRDLFRGKPVALMGASPGNFGTTLAQAHWLPVIRTLGMRPWFEGRLMVPRAREVFDGEGKLVDDETRQRLAEFMRGFADFLPSS
ncbi:NAD(P)H-dependent oxidoreductase [Cereibacter sphaeroides]|uniref:NADPH-dependent FMN reductase n=1 Tax=Cereibacter sphaeroides TaxID=1063 RepID=UPI001F3B59A9|nr:NADPH-dependent FMN reductase [Cereibacter sphaeroides]MCE6960815.1 NAD(P)H-dependent oxidoreductase [Cereibacter sphaeroides]MCE6974307.1 NAD(P)H-dependent oxidoreductase [Cereibacter sphaeroides]